MAQFSTALRNARLAAITTAVGTNGRFRVYDSEDTLLADLACSATFAAEPSDGVLTANPITQDFADASGVAAYAQVCKSDGTPVIRLTVSEAGQGGDAIINDVHIVQGGVVSVTSLTITEGNAGLA